MKTRKSLNRRILIYVGGSSAMFVLLYSFIIAAYFMFGVKVNNKIILANEARAYADAYVHDVHTPKPERSFLKSYRNEKNIPKALLEIFPLNERKHGDMRLYDAELFGNIGNYEFEAQQLKDYCRGVRCEIFLFYSYHLKDDQWLYLTMGISPEESEKEHHEEFDAAFYILISITIAFFITVMVLTLALVRNISQPITALAKWAQELKSDNVDDDLPNLRFTELEVVANQLQFAFIRINNVLEHEKQFLNNASHELRTPIAVLATNLALLEKMRIKGSDSEAQDKVIERLSRAIENMKQLVQTILWLSKNTDDLPAEETVELDVLIEQIINDNRYLNEQKAVTVTANLHPVSISVSRSLCVIILTNLIRNAFQYTHQGTVDITVQSDFIKVTNQCFNANNDILPAEELGFGLGLELVRRASLKLAWRYESDNITGGRSVTLYF
ncbi:MAG: hypothetical protein BM565_11235 [Gammaproteobacteria bacterium MedPE]|nr:MAG: hypothetical protein BM565_11235 [Gammaproteobacteria bacterium MedPE]